MIEWHLDPVYIVNNWTNELLSLMIEKMIERKKRESDAIKKPEQVSDEMFFAQASNLIKVVKK